MCTGSKMTTEGMRAVTNSKHELQLEAGNHKSLLMVHATHFRSMRGTPDNLHGDECSNALVPQGADLQIIVARTARIQRVHGVVAIRGASCSLWPSLHVRF